MMIKKQLSWILSFDFIVTIFAYNASFYPEMSLWHTLRPGELLHNLDLVTAEAKLIQTPFILPSPPADLRAATVSPTPKAVSSNYSLGTARSIKFPLHTPHIQRRIENHADNQYSTEDHLNTGHSNEYDYDRAYDQFVQQYFGSARDDALDDVQSGSIEFDEQEQPYSTEYESSEPLTAPAVKVKSKQRCKKVFKNQQECMICKNPKNNEKSETCSFSTESEPEAYAYTKEKSYKKHRDSSDESLENDEDDDDIDENEKKSVGRRNTKSPKRYNKASSKVKQHHKRLAKRNGKDFDKPIETSSCTRKYFKNKICYYCTKSGEKNVSRCFAKETDPLSISAESSAGGKQNHSKTQIKKSEKKIHKRMVSYSYENGTNLDLSNESTYAAEKNVTTADPSVKP